LLFLPLVSDDQVRRSALKLIASFSGHCDKSVEYFLAGFERLFERMYEDMRPPCLGSDLLAFLNRQWPKFQVRLNFERLFRWCGRLPQSELARAVVHQAIDLFVRVSPSRGATSESRLSKPEIVLRDFTQLEAAAFHGLLVHQYGSKPNVPLIVDFFSIISAVKVVTPTPTFLIRSARGLRVMVDYFKITDHFAVVIGFLARLCEFSSANCAIVHTTGIDVALLSCVSEQLDSAPLVCRLFQDEKYTLLFLPLVSDDQVRRSALKVIANFSKHCDKSVEYFLAGFERLFERMYEDMRAPLLGSDLLAFLNRQWPKFQVRLNFERLFRWCGRLPQSELARAVVHQAIDLFVRVSPSRGATSEPRISKPEIVLRDFTQLEAAAFYGLLVHQYGSKPNVPLIVDFFSIISAVKVVTPTPTFLIRSARGLRVMVDYFKITDHFAVVIAFLARLCEFSSANCAIVHTTGIDVALLSCVSEQLDSNSPDTILISAILTLVSFVAVTCSSPRFVKNYLALFRPRNDNGRSFPLMLKSLSQILWITESRPAASIPVQRGSRIDLAGITGRHFVDGFTISFWISVPFPTCSFPSPLISVDDGRGSKYALHLQEANFMAYGDGESRHWNGFIPDLFRSEDWSLVTVSFRTEPTKRLLQTSYTLNGVTERPLSFPTVIFADGPLQVCIGGCLVGQSDMPVIRPRIGPFGVFPFFKGDTPKRLFDAGPRAWPNPQEVTAWLYAVPESVGGLLRLPVRADPAFGASISSADSPVALTFMDMFLDKFPSEHIIPLFAESSLHSEACGVPESIIDVLTYILGHGEPAQIGFCAAGGFAMIGQILDVGFTGRIRFSIFSRFLNLLSVLTSACAREQFLFHVILNLQIWIRLEGNTHVQYLRDLLCVVLPNHCQAFAASWDALSIIAMTRIYYYYEPIEMSFAFPDRPPGLDVAGCRSVMYTMAEILCHESFDTKILDLRFPAFWCIPT
jgi:SpoU rRNA methylase family enzyme